MSYGWIWSLLSARGHVACSHAAASCKAASFFFHVIQAQQRIDRRPSIVEIIGVRWQLLQGLVTFKVFPPAQGVLTCCFKLFSPTTHGSLVSTWWIASRMVEPPRRAGRAPKLSSSASRRVSRPRVVAIICEGLWPLAIPILRHTWPGCVHRFYFSVSLFIIDFPVSALPCAPFPSHCQ